MTTRKMTAEERQAQVDAIAERFAKLPTSINAPARANTALCIPTGDHRIDSLCMRGVLESIPQWAGFIEQPGCSHVQLARIKMLHQFMQSPFEWCVMIDSDVGFTADDFQYLLDCSPNATINEFLDTARNPHVFAANAVYARKDDSGEVIYNGLGFARVHRSVFDVLAQTLAPHTSVHGVAMIDYFPSGAYPNGQWLTEDAGFWLLCHQIGVDPRRETRTRLKHAGRAVYEVDPLMIPSAAHRIHELRETNDIEQPSE